MLQASETMHSHIDSFMYIEKLPISQYIVSNSDNNLTHDFNIIFYQTFFLHCSSTKLQYDYSITLEIKIRFDQISYFNNFSTVL